MLIQSQKAVWLVATGFDCLINQYAHSALKGRLGNCNVFQIKSKSCRIGAGEAFQRTARSGKLAPIGHSIERPTLAKLVISQRIPIVCQLEDYRSH